MKTNPSPRTAYRPRRPHTTPSGTMLEPLDARLLFATLYVSTAGADLPGRGTQTTQPFQSIQFAVNQATSGDTIKVAQGTYTYNAAADTFTNRFGTSLSITGTFGTTAVVFIPDKNLSILGGYAPDFSSRSSVASSTVIDGAGTTRGVMTYSSFVGAPSGLTLDGFAITNGLAGPIPLRTTLDRVWASGGGLFIDQSATPTTAPHVLTNLVFSNNVAKAATLTTGADTAGGHAFGGAIAIRSSSNNLLANITFTGNQAIAGDGPTRGGSALGGAVYVSRSVVNATNLTLTGNIARAGNSAGSGTTTDGERADAIGGAICTQLADLTMTFVTATNNKVVSGDAGSASGAVAGAALGSFLLSEGKFSTTDGLETASVSIRSSSISGGLSTGGTGFEGGNASGALFVLNTSLVVDRCKIFNNVSNAGSSSGGSTGKAGSSAGGALYMTRNDNRFTLTTTVTNSVLAANTLTTGTASGPDAYELGGGGGGIFVQGIANAVFDHLTIADNVLGANLFFGAGVLVLGEYNLASGTAPLSSTATLTNSVLTNNRDGIGGSTELHSQDNSTLTLGRNLVITSGPLTKVITGGLINGTANLLTSGAVNFASAGQPNFNYTPTTGSATIDAATGSTVTLDAQSFPRSGTPDLGALEAGSTATTSIAVTKVPTIAQGSVATFAVAISSANGGPVAVNYLTGNGTATAGADYSGTSGPLTFAPGETVKLVTVPILASKATADLSFNFFIGAATPGVTVTVGSSTATIAGFLDLPAASVADIVVNRPKSGTTVAVFTIRLSKAGTRDVVIDYATLDGTAGAGTDYVAAQGTVTIAAGQTSATVSATVNGTFAQRGSPTFFLTLNTPRNVTLAVTQAAAKINDVVLPTVSLVTAVSVLEPGIGTSQALFPVTLSYAVPYDVTLTYSTTDGTAFSGQDYAGQVATITIPAGVTTATISVNVVPNPGNPRPSPTFSLDIGGPLDKVGFGNRTAVASITKRAAIARTLLVTGKSIRTYVDAKGVEVSVAITGPGKATIDFPSKGNSDPLLVTIAGTTTASTVTFSTRRLATRLSEVSIQSSLKAFVAPVASFSGGKLMSLAAVGSVSVNNLSSSSVSFSGGTTTLTAVSVADTSLTSTGSFKAVTVRGWTNNKGGSLLSAQSIGTFTSKTSATSAIVATSGDVGTVAVGSTFSGSITARRNIGVVLAKSLSNATIDAGAKLGDLTTVGGISDSVVHAATGIKALVASSMTRSRVLLAVPANTSTPPTSIATVRTAKGPVPTLGLLTLSSSRKTFSASLVVAPKITKIDVGQVVLGAGKVTPAQGVVSNSIAEAKAGFAGTKPFSDRNLRAGTTFSRGDFVIRVLK